MTRATITTELDFEGFSIEVDGEYWRYEDEQVTDLTLCFLWIEGPDSTGKTRRYDLLKGLDRPSLLCVERNLFKIPGIVERLCADIATQGDDMHLEPDTYVKDY